MKAILIIYFMINISLYAVGLEKPANIREMTGTTDARIMIGWDTVSDADGYYIYQIVDGNRVKIGETMNGSSYTYEITSLTPYTDYTYCVKAYSSSIGESGCSTPITIKTLHTWHGDLKNCLLNKLGQSDDYTPDRQDVEGIDTFYCPNVNVNYWDGSKANIDELRDLVYIRDLNVSGGIYTPFPSWIGELNLLYSLKLNGKFGGELPEDIGDKLPHLIYLSIEGERNTHAALPLHGSLPSSIGGMIDLKFLSILGDFNGSIPEAFANLGQLETLNLHANQLSGDAGVLSELSTLQYLNLGDNNFTSVPDLSHMSSLKTLILSGIPLKTFPLWLKKMTSLEKLNLEQCNIQGIIPKWIGDLVNLESLKLQGNKLFGNVPVTILNLTQIPNFRGQLDLYTNCDLYADNQDVKDFIQEKSCYEIEDQFFLCQSENTHADYDRLINSNTHKCDLGFSAIRMFLLD